MGDSMNTGPNYSVSSVYSAYGTHTTYLEIVREGNKLRVQRTSLGKRTLNRFWIVWLRKLLLEQTQGRRLYTVDVCNNCVIVSSNATIDACLGTVYQIAAQLRPLKNPPLEIVTSGNLDPKVRRYDLKIGPEPRDWKKIIDTIVMPDGIRLELFYWPAHMTLPAEGRVCLVRPLVHLLSLSQLGMLLELEVALACDQ